ncbi:7-cyano-7-deazaguanine synthase [Caballeronia sp. J97]|uniref:7-cyano-7-deazaguanine synthase n=1 Tax=Caballeronia sp. J97 TaxID=2805429 RepID=UPI002AB1CD9D|nr:7-cyano-7-deazaguanine synthase [Caballeronia sp. J97]
MNADPSFITLKSLTVDLVEPGQRPRRGALACRLGRNISFDTAILETFSSTNWRPVVYDALVVAAAVEFCDRSLSRSALNWGRRFDVHVPVHDPARWMDAQVTRSLVGALNFLTGDEWHFHFRARKAKAELPPQSRMEFPTDAAAVMAYSEGMDSRAVYGLEHQRLGAQLVRVRVGTKWHDVPKKKSLVAPFAALPYEVKLDEDNAENSARSRGFKFALISAVAAYLINAPTAIVPESGQGALAPALLPVGQGYADFRNHPDFTALMQKFVSALFGHRLTYTFPRIWSTKGETLREYVDLAGEQAAWLNTRSCWQNARQVSVSKSRRQCGVCAACILRRLSVHAAGLSEPPEQYVWESLAAATFEAGAANGFTQVTKALREYAIAGVLHFKHLAQIRDSSSYGMVRRRVTMDLSRSLSQPADEVGQKLDRLLEQHAKEWSAFTNDLGSQSFVKKWMDIAS